MPTKSTAKKEGAESVKKTPVKKAAPAKAPAVEEVYVQFGGEEWKVADLSERAKAAYLAQGHRASGIKKLSHRPERLPDGKRHPPPPARPAGGGTL